MWRPRQYWRARRAIALMNASRWPEVIPVAASIERSGDLSIRRLALLLSARGLQFIDDYHGAFDRFTELVALDDEPADSASNLLALAQVQTTLGLYRDAVATARQACRIARGQPDEPLHRAAARRVEAFVAYLRGDLDNSWLLIGNARHDAVDRLDAINDLMLEAFLLDAGGHTVEAASKAAHVIRLRQQVYADALVGAGISESAALVGLTGAQAEHSRLAARSGATDAARASVDAARHGLSELPWPRPRVGLHVSLAQAATATAEQQPGDAVDHAERALTIAEHLRLPDDIANAHRAAAIGYQMTGAEAEATLHRSAAHDIFTSLGRALAAADTRAG
jgi:tetratricopeptide (TPR) repeat protein